ncbi:MAG: histidinol-phosphate aminotransferase family protein [Actinomycetia bacterium]|nr:histidinol-phosphate aminotransferase family protein [Actinomycetes bacterium]
MTPKPTYRWQPTTAEVAERFGLLESQIVRFDHNTSPNDTAWAAGIVSPVARGLNEYPGASYLSLRRAAGNYVGIDEMNIVPGAGIDELILLVAKAFLRPESQATAVVPTYPLYEIATTQHGADFVPVEQTRLNMFPLDAFSEAAETSDVTWLCVPNNPTGERIDDEAIRRILRSAKGLVVLDAAYAEYAGDRWAAWVNHYPNLLVLHTLSKGFALAGIRVGFGVGNTATIGELDKVRPPGSIATLSQFLAEKALAEPQRMLRAVEGISKERARFTTALSDAGIAVLPSTTNFVLCHFGPHAGDLANLLLTEGLIVRSYPQEHQLHTFLRFTVRSSVDNDRLVAAIRRHS